MDFLNIYKSGKKTASFRRTICQTRLGVSAAKIHSPLDTVLFKNCYQVVKALLCGFIFSQYFLIILGPSMHRLDLFQVSIWKRPHMKHLAFGFI